jgi:hypothetical protein
VLYATADELAAQLRVAPTLKNADQLAACVAAASREIDHELDPVTDSPPLTDPGDLALAHQVCIARGVEWYKTNDSVFGVIGFADTGVLAAPRDTFARHSATLIPLRQQFGVA